MLEHCSASQALSWRPYFLKTGKEKFSANWCILCIRYRILVVFMMFCCVFMFPSLELSPPYRQPYVHVRLFVRSCCLSALCWRTQTLTTPWCLKLLICTRLTVTNMRLLLAAGHRSMPWVNCWTINRCRPLVYGLSRNKAVFGVLFSVVVNSRWLFMQYSDFRICEYKYWTSDQNAFLVSIKYQEIALYVLWFRFHIWDLNIWTHSFVLLFHNIIAQFCSMLCYNCNYMHR